MHLRRMTRADLPHCADVAAQAWIQDPVYAYTHPRRHQHPRNFRNISLQSLRARLLNPAFALVVCATSTAEDADLSAALAQAKAPGWTGSEWILGYCVWLGVGVAVDRSDDRSATVLFPLERLLLRLEARYAAFVHPDPGADPEKVAVFAGLVAAYEGWKPLGPRMHLASLCTSTAAQRRGVGALLVGWGLRRAGEERVPATLVSSVSGIGLYRRMGFLVVDWPQLRIGEGGAKMVWDPEGEWVVLGEGEVLRGGVVSKVDATFKVGGE